MQNSGTLIISILSLLGWGASYATRTVTINGTATLTIQAGTTKQCVQELEKSSGITKQHKLVYSVSDGTLLTFQKCPGISLTLQDNYNGGACNNSQAELYLSAGNSTYDVSLVNGYSGPVTIAGNKTISVTSKTANNSADNAVDGVYPYGCSTCTGRISADCGSSTPSDTCSASTNCQITDGTTDFTVTFGSSD